MAEQLAHSEKVGAKVKHHRRERVPGAVERDLLVDTRTSHPGLDGIVGAGGRMKVRENPLRRQTPLAHQRHRLRRDVKVFLAIGLLLAEDDELDTMPVIQRWFLACL